ncbi:MAG TPA: hypothetical protein VKH18_08950 [Terriglobales bacterium]|nr:hypothetical protein [Terriglobales bacterium]
MPSRLESRHLAAELAALDQLLASLRNEDAVGRMGLQSRREELYAELNRLQQHPETAASVALLFGGRPVVGSRGIESTFAASVVSDFQELVTNVWATAENDQVGRRGPVPDRQRSQLHITSLLHGSVGFLLEELEDDNALFPSPLKKAAERAAQVVAAFAADDDARFAEMLESVDQRVLSTTREFLRKVHRGGATLRLVEGEHELELNDQSIVRAYERAESASIEESEEEVRGQLLGLIPIGRRFEIQTESGDILSGIVAPTLSESYLQKLHDEQLVGKQCSGRIRRKRILRFGRATDSVLLLDLAAVTPQSR